MIRSGSCDRLDFAAAEPRPEEALDPEHQVEFEWDPTKTAANERKHGVTFPETATVFGDPLAATFDDPDHSVDEQRYITFGMSQSNRLLVVSHSDRGDRVRIISARRMTRQETSIYERG